MARFNYTVEPIPKWVEDIGGQYESKLVSFHPVDNVRTKYTPGIVYESDEQSSRYPGEARYIALMSYATMVEVYDVDKSNWIRLWDSRSNTTSRHEWDFRRWLQSNRGHLYRDVVYDGENTLHGRSVLSGWCWCTSYPRKTNWWPEFTELYWRKVNVKPTRWAVSARVQTTHWGNPSIDDWMSYEIEKRTKEEPWALICTWGKRKLLGTYRTFKLAESALREDVDFRRTVCLLEKYDDVRSNV